VLASTNFIHKVPGFTELAILVNSKLGPVSTTLVLVNSNLRFDKPCFGRLHFGDPRFGDPRFGDPRFGQAVNNP
jgi:hypothetical protein